MEARRILSRASELASDCFVIPSAQPKFVGLNTTLDREARLTRALSTAELAVIELLPHDSGLSFYSDSTNLLGFDHEPDLADLETAIGVTEFQRIKKLTFSAMRAPEKSRQTDFRFAPPGAEPRWLHARFSAHRTTGKGGALLLRAVISDITERKTREISLQQGDLIKSAMLETALDAIITVNSEGRVVGWNAAAEHLFGQPRDIAMGQDLAELIYPPDQAHDRRVGMRRMLANGAGMGRKLNLEMVKGDGTRFDCEMSVRALEVGGEQHFTAFMRPTEKRPEPEAADEKGVFSEAAMRSMADLNPSITWLACADGAVTYLNSQWQEFTGLDPAESIPVSWFSVLHPHDLASMMLFWDECTKNGVSGKADVRFRRKDGVFRWCEVVCRPQINSAGALIGWVATATDVDERRQREDHLREQRDRLWNMSQDLIGVYQPDGTLIAYNPAWTSLLGIPSAEMEGTKFSAWISLEGVRKSSLSPSIKSGEEKAFLFDARVHARDGGEKLISWTVAPHAGLYYAVGRDLTAERSASEALESSRAALFQAQKMEAIGQLTGGIAHDLNNTLQGVVGGMSLAEIAIEHDEPQKAIKAMGIATRSARRASSFIERLLVFARRKQLEIAPITVGDVVLSMQELIQSTIGKSTLQIDLGTNHFDARADINQLESALLNLAINSRDAMPKGGTFSIAVEHHRDVEAPHQKRKGDWIVLAVADTGCGMRPEEVEKAFEPFFTTKPVGQGTGLGLSMVYGFIQQIGGHVEIESELNVGTRVTMWLPRAIDEEDTFELEPFRSADLSNISVLLVESEASTADEIAMMFDHIGCNVRRATSAEEALPMVQSGEVYDLMVTSDSLPGMNGRQLADIARQDHANLKVIFLTGYLNSPILAAGALSDGMIPMMRPLEQPNLLAALNELFAETEDQLIEVGSFWEPPRTVNA